MPLRMRDRAARERCRLQRRGVVGIAGEPIRNQLDLLVRRIVEGEQACRRLDQAFDGIVIIEIGIHFAQDAQLAGGFLEIDDRDRIAVDVTQPTQGRRRFDLESRLGDVKSWPSRGRSIARWDPNVTVAIRAEPQNALHS
jgi:hypothetical protein